jgi:hypothetical protein
MKRVSPSRSRLLVPLVYLAALLLLLEDWFWNLGARLSARLADWPALQGLERRLRALPPYAALCVFVLPGLLLVPVKILALLAIARGHPVSGIATLVVAKLGGAALVARLYFLTRPTLLALPWFARWHNRFIVAKDRTIMRLRTSELWRRARKLTGQLRRLLRRFRRVAPARPFGHRLASRSARVLRRVAALWRARRR